MADDQLKTNERKGLTQYEYRKQKEAEVSTSTMMWDIFCKLLDDIRVRDAGGELSNMWCAACENSPHAKGMCDCGCHAAWALRERMERKVKAA